MQVENLAKLKPWTRLNTPYLILFWHMSNKKGEHIKLLYMNSSYLKMHKLNVFKSSREMEAMHALPSMVTQNTKIHLQLTIYTTNIRY